MKICLEEIPEEIWINENHKASCWCNIRDQILAGEGKTNE
jgi:oligopeptide transport system ATP-binding protein